MTRTTHHRLLSLPIFATLMAGLAFAQIAGDLKGSVVDSSDSPVPQAKVTIRNLATGEARTAGVDAQGRFVFSLLKIGMYEARAEAANFRVSSTQVEVKSGDAASLRFQLEVGQVTESVTVTGAVSQIDTENAQIQRSFTGETVLELPVNRNPNNFAIMSPGTAPVSSNNPFLGSGSFNSNGGRGRGNNIMVNGVTATDVSVTGTGGALTPLIFNTISEVKVITNNFNAEYGRNSSAQVIYLTGGGSNKFSGEAWEYLQNDKLNARPFFDRTGKTNIVRFNQYGFRLGGPVYIPKVVDGRNKFFWMAAYEGQKKRGAGATRVARVPTPTQIASVTDPSAKALLDQYKLPTDPSGSIQTASPNSLNLWKVNLRGDVNISSRDQLWVTYFTAESSEASAGLTFVGGNLLGFGASSANKPRTATLSETHTFGSSSVNEFRFGYGRSAPAFPIDTPFPLGARITFQDNAIASFGVWEGLPQGREQDTFQFSDAFSTVRGRHALKMGGEFYYLKADSVFDAFQRPTMAFANFADFARGVPATLTQRFGNSVRANRVRNLYTFFQDDWKATRNLTINLGLRLEWAGGPTEANGLISNLNLDNKSAFGAAGGGPFGLLETGKPSFKSNSNWGPRLGFAWTPRGNQKMVIRGGYGIAYDFVFLNPITNQRFLPPFIVTGSLTGQQSFTGDNALARILAGTSKVQADTKAQMGQLSTSTLNFGAISPAIAQDLANSQIQQWNLGVQREWAGTVFKATYVGTKGTYLPRTRDINLLASPVAAATTEADETARLAQFQSANAGLSGGAGARSNRIDGRYNAIGYVESSALSNYHGGQFEASRRMGTLFLSANYTFAKSIDDNSDVLGVLINDSSNQQNPRDNRNNRAVSQFDLQNRFVFVHAWEPRLFRNSSSRVLRTVVGGWGFAGFSSMRTGFPVTLDAGVRRGLSPLAVAGGGTAIRPNAPSPVNFQPKPAGSAGSAFGLTTGLVQNISAYAQSLGLSQPLLGNFGNMGRNVLRLNGERNFDWNFYKSFRFNETAFVRFQAEFYNFFNNTSFQEVDRTLTSTNFGQYTTVAQDARVIQFGLRFVF